jgi:hypothetical protein
VSFFFSPQDRKNNNTERDFSTPRFLAMSDKKQSTVQGAAQNLSCYSLALRFA